ncbi:hypothetical protein D4M88_17425 [Enterobacter roggenkampii]|nr:hypothetical protein YA48_12315 [Enterobacter roggenkampii]TXU39889.1 hypothetical protein D4M93_16615 [Enterobacter roggenkampii]TXU87316.1 hypothetical protein D4M95_17445 [Enterobacter roggenkampii]TXU98052.1 hypothetical protein D4M88_17425 [Enterobacter roggenkampii]TYF70161.1 hypothetical protein DJ544_05710 [Enterobacter roggenkampii]
MMKHEHRDAPKIWSFLMYWDAITSRGLLPTFKASSEKIASAYLRIDDKMAFQRRTPVKFFASISRRNNE